MKLREKTTDQSGHGACCHSHGRCSKRHTLVGREEGNGKGRKEKRKERQEIRVQLELNT